MSEPDGTAHEMNEATATQHAAKGGHYFCLYVAVQIILFLRIISNVQQL